MLGGWWLIQALPACFNTHHWLSSVGISVRLENCAIKSLEFSRFVDLPERNIDFGWGDASVVVFPC